PANCNQNRGMKNYPTQPLPQQHNPYPQDSYYFPLYWGY
ncbi:cupin, partial [Bacillus thuringiensis]